MTELPFLLTKGEKLLKDKGGIFYTNKKLNISAINLSSSFGGNSSLGSTYGNIKKTPNLHSVHAYLTNKRIVICKSIKGAFGFGKEKGIGEMIAEIEFNSIKNVQAKANKLALGGTESQIILNIKVGSEIEEVIITFSNEVKDNEEWVKLIKKNI
mgnify:FL=1